MNDLHDDDNAKESINQVQATGAQAVFVQGDISKVENIQALITQAVQAFGQLDILINNAGVEIHAPFWEVTEQQYDIVMNVN